MKLINMEAVGREVWEDIMVVGGNGNQPYRVLQRLELELYPPTHSYAYVNVDAYFPTLAKPFPKNKKR